MPLQDITPLPDPPQRSDPPEVFIEKADAFLSSFTLLQSQINTLSSQLEVAAAVLAAATAYPDPGLLALVGLTPAADKLPYFTGPAGSALATLTAAGRALLDDADASAQLTTLGVSDYIKTLLNDGDAATARATLGAPGVGEYQPLDSDLSAIALLVTTSFGRNLLTLADAAAGRAALGIASVSGSSGSWKISFGSVVLTVRDFTIGSNTIAAINYGDDHEYSSWARAFTDGDDAAGDRSIMISGTPGLTSANVRSNTSGSSNAILFSIGV